jgi:hypothetical protein
MSSTDNNEIRWTPPNTYQNILDYNCLDILSSDGTMACQAVQCGFFDKIKISAIYVISESKGEDCSLISGTKYTYAVWSACSGMINDNDNVSYAGCIAEGGEITGDTTYTITYVDIEEQYLSANIYPNPVNDELIIDLNTQWDNTDINIFNQMGTLVASMKLNKSQTKVDMSSFTPGIYLLSIRYNNQNIIRRIIKL